MRRDAGDGALYFSSTHERWVGELIIGHRADGGRIMKTCRSAIKGNTAEAKRDCRARLDRLRAEIEEEARRKAEAADLSNYTVWDAITDWHAWVPGQEKTSQQTADKYLGQARKWVKPRIGDVFLEELDLAALQDFLEEIAPELGAASLRDILSTLKRAFRYARRRKKLTGPNVAEEAELPRAGHVPREWDFLNQDQVESILEQAEGSQRVLLMTGFMLGLRPGEIRALKWDYIDLKKGVLYVVAWARKDVDGETKTVESRRAIRLPARLRAALRWFHRVTGGTGYVFTDQHGQQLGKDDLRTRFGKVMRQSGYPEIEDPYVMRHTFASIADANGVPHQKIADMMGHKDVTTFERIYRHRLNPEITETADLMDGIWGVAA